MNIEVIKENKHEYEWEKNADLEREVYRFTLLEDHGSNPFRLILDSYALQTKSKRQRNWRTQRYYNGYDHRYQDENKPDGIPFEVLIEAKNQFHTAIENIKAEIR